jgi:exopolyphosphatase/guanosine-5'-triphosphate,3'-diphosphate pyrophosphatase
MRKRLSISILAVILGILMLLFWLPTNQAILAKGEIRAAMDIGSGATNLKIAKVDPTTDKIIAILFEKSIPVPYQKHLEQSTNNTFDQQVMDEGISAIKALKQVADEYHVKKVVGVATAAFRQSSNAEDFANQIKEKTGVPVRIINQDEEGILAFRGALALTSVDPNHAVVWDIGGGSMQLTTLSDEGTYLVEKGKTASVPFKNYVIENIQHKDLSKTQTPNPMNREELQAAIQYAENLAQSSTDPYIKAKIIKENTHVLAVGNLFNIGMKGMVESSHVKRDALEKATFLWVGKTDEELPGKGAIAEVAVTNPAMVLGYMEGLHIKQVDTVDVNNADGALTYPPYWQ